MNPDRKEQVERTVSEAMADNDQEAVEPALEAPRRLSPRYEIRQIVDLDPIMEETRIYRSIAKEVDNRYDHYVNNVRNRREDRSQYTDENEQKE